MLEESPKLSMPESDLFGGSDRSFIEFCLEIAEGNCPTIKREFFLMFQL
jgi:hypothetical protein